MLSQPPTQTDARRDAAPPPDQPETARDPLAPPANGLVGRAEELAVLRQAVEAAFAGATGVVIVEGEAGIGKTRLLEEVVAEAARRGALVVWGRCLEGDGTPSMWPWVQAIGAVVDGLPTSDAGGVAHGRARPPRGSSQGDPAAPLLPDSGAQFRLFERAVAVVGLVASERPVGTRDRRSPVGRSSPRCGCSVTWRPGCRPAP